MAIMMFSMKQIEQVNARETTQACLVEHTTHITHSTVYCSVMNPRNNFSLSGPYVLQKNVVKFGTLSYFFLPLLIFVVVLLKTSTSAMQ